MVAYEDPVDSFQGLRMKYRLLPWRALSQQGVISPQVTGAVSRVLVLKRLHLGKEIDVEADTVTNSLDGIPINTLWNDFDSTFVEIVGQRRPEK